MDATRLTGTLEEMATFLEQCGDRRWPTILRQLRSLISPVGPTGKPDWEAALTRIRPLFGGMGSLNDLYLCQENGHSVPDEQRANEDFNARLAALYRAYSDCVVTRGHSE